MAAAGVVDDTEGRILPIRQRDSGQWQIPGGVQEPSKQILDRLVREIREETGYTIEPQALTDVYKNMNRIVLAPVFRCTPLSGIATTDDEASQMLWLAPDDAAPHMTEAFGVRMTDALTGPWPQLRHHDGRVLMVESRLLKHVSTDCQHVNPESF